MWLVLSFSVCKGFEQAVKKQTGGLFFRRGNERQRGDRRGSAETKSLRAGQKETGESIYWLTLLKRTKLIDYNFDNLISLAEEIKRMLIASLNTAKVNNR